MIIAIELPFQIPEGGKIDLPRPKDWDEFCGVANLVVYDTEAKSIYVEVAETQDLVMFDFSCFSCDEIFKLFQPLGYFVQFSLTL